MEASVGPNELDEVLRRRAEAWASAEVQWRDPQEDTLEEMFDPFVKERAGLMEKRLEEIRKSIK